MERACSRISTISCVIQNRSLPCSNQSRRTIDPDGSTQHLGLPTYLEPPFRHFRSCLSAYALAKCRTHPVIPMIIGDSIWGAVFSASPTFFKPALYSSTELKVYGRGRFCRSGLPTRNDLLIKGWRSPCAIMPIQRGIELPQHRQLQHTIQKQLLVSTSHL
jgi:hypothetical protein